MNPLESTLWLICILSVAVTYGTDTFFAVVGRYALERSTPASVADMMGRIHEFADGRMPVFVMTGLVSSLVLSFVLGWVSLAGVLTLVAFGLLVAHLVVWAVVARPINARLIAAARAGIVPDDTRAMQQRWDSVIGWRALLLFGALALIALAGR